MLDDEDDKAIVKGIIGLATAFQRQVIAEGVETIAIGNHLLAMGCEFAQGYGIAMPMPAADIDSWITQWKPDSSWTE
jgi:EAL domain-containing protein (putative c-di-GMP-specific phosphodiesterase class I)